MIFNKCDEFIRKILVLKYPRVLGLMFFFFQLRGSNHFNLKNICQFSSCLNKSHSDSFWWKLLITVRRD